MAGYGDGLGASTIRIREGFPELLTIRLQATFSDLMGRCSLLAGTVHIWHIRRSPMRLFQLGSG
jgi:hypothetical protein